MRDKLVKEANRYLNSAHKNFNTQVYGKHGSACGLIGHLTDVMTESGIAEALARLGDDKN